MDVLDALTRQAYTLLTSRADTPAVRLVRALHPDPSGPDAIPDHLAGGNTTPSLSALSRYAQAGDPHALLMAAVLMRAQLRAVTTTAGDHDGTDTLTAFWTLIRTAAGIDLHTADRSADSRLRPNGYGNHD